MRRFIAVENEDGHLDFVGVNAWRYIWWRTRDLLSFYRRGTE